MASDCYYTTLYIECPNVGARGWCELWTAYDPLVLKFYKGCGGDHIYTIDEHTSHEEGWIHKLIAVGKPRALYDSGRVVIYSTLSKDYIQILQLSEAFNTQEFFGYSLSADDGLLAVGAPGWGPYTFRGAVFVYQWNPRADYMGEYQLIETFHPSDRDNGFGYLVHLTQGTLTVDNEHLFYINKHDL